MRQEEDITRRVLALWANGIEGVRAAYRLHHDFDIHWWNSARGSVHGRDACIAGCEAMFDLLGVASVRVPIREIVAHDGLVMVERSDDLYRADGTLIESVSVTGVIRFDGNMIVEWRDYCIDWLAAWLPKDLH